MFSPAEDEAEEERVRELFWEQLLQHIEEGRVVPVVGQELLRLPFASGEVQLYPYLAGRLAEKLGVSGEGLSAASALHEVACRHIEKPKREVEEVYSALKSVLPGPGELPIPEPLRKLAAIEPFRLFITTTFDLLLKRAVDEIRFAGKERTQVLAYSPDDPQDLPVDASKLERPVVYQLFGQISGSPGYAVTEEDMLEFVYSLQSEDRRPAHLFDALTDRDLHLLVLGVSFPSWLSRFFLRIAKRERLLLNRKMDVVADSAMSSDSDFVLFLQRFSARTKVFRGGGAVEFIAELDRRWRERYPAGFRAIEKGADWKRPEMTDGAVFISYAHEDLEKARLLKEQLERAGLDVWMDMESLEPGDPYEEEIKRAIDHCSAFVPLLSSYVLTAHRRFFRLEWDHAEQVAKRVQRTARFIVPVALDEISSTDERLPKGFRTIHWGRMDGELVRVLTTAYLDYRRPQGSAS